MTTAGTPWRKLLACAVFFLLLPGGETLSCSNLAVDSSVVPMGGTVSATCTIWKRRCPIQEDGEVHILWKWNERLLSGTQHSLSDGVEVSNLTVGPLNQTLNLLSCWLQRKGPLQMMDLIRIQAGYPPSEPHNLTCVMNITSFSLRCWWDPGEDSLLSVNVTLEGVRSGSECTAHLQDVPLCVPSAGQNSCSVPRQHLFLYQNMIFWVSAKNDLGSARSRPLCADPMDLVKLDPPTLRVIQSVPKDTDCVAVAWEGPKGSEYMDQACELGYRVEGEHSWTSVYVGNVTPSAWQTEHCGFLFATHYQFQLRCQKLPAGYWSDWSPTMNFTTHEKAPSGKLDTWWKVKTQEAGKGREVQLLWKPMKPNETHGNILGYWATLSSRPQSRKPPALCHTTDLHCTFLLPPGTQRIFLVAFNSRGASQPTEVSLLEKKGQPVPKIWTSPYDAKSLWVHWDPPGERSATGYIIEWCKVTSADRTEDNGSMKWTKVHNGATTQALIQEGFEPFQRYNVSIYPLYRDALGMPQSVEVYTLQKAPSEGPKLHPGNISKSTAEVHWEPVPVEKRNGFIISYTLFWIGTDEVMSSAVVNASIHSFTVKGLWPSRMYQVHIMASTVAGSTNGSALTLYTKATDDTDTTFVFITAGLLLVMLIILVFCFQKSKRMKTQFWPSVPDPANSSLGKWAPAVLQEETAPPPPPLKPCELSPVVVSAVLVIETDEKKCLSCGKTEPGKALEDGPTTFHISYVHDADATALLNGSLPPASYVNSPESVQYAKVVGDSYRRQPQANVPTFYMRSDSTQPLLGEPTPSPKLYENLWFRNDQPDAERGSSFQEEAVFLERTLLDFPLLQGLRIDGGEDLGNFRRL
uniref:Granulocyte colony-stimulating factor receptor isoform X1 n=1 Tax=Pogona vitticeps TaxID=103695 RepID=A0ABM5ET76_9SAUR